MCYLFKKKNKLKKSSKDSSCKQKTRHKLQQLLLASSPKYPDCYYEPQEGVPQGQKDGHSQEWIEEACCVAWADAGRTGLQGWRLWQEQPAALSNPSWLLANPRAGAWVAEA